MSIFESYLGEHGFLGLVFGFIRGIIKRDGLTVVGWIVTVFISVNVAVISGQVGEAMGFQNGMVYAIVAIASLISKDLASGLVLFAEQVARNPRQFWREWRGAKD